MAFQLVMRSGPNPGERYNIEQNEITIGRDVANEITINDPEVSRKHARLIMQSGGYLLEDLGSTNGTFVNGQRLTSPHVLRPGDVVMLGENVSLAYESGYDPNATVISTAKPAAAPPPPPPSQPAVPQPPPAVSHKAPPIEPQPQYPPQQKKSSKTLLWAGLGCLLVILCLVVAGVVAFDYLDLYCTPPFDALAGMFYTCP